MITASAPRGTMPPVAMATADDDPVDDISVP
jgi:hypothetical protein